MELLFLFTGIIIGAIATWLIANALFKNKIPDKEQTAQLINDKNSLELLFNLEKEKLQLATKELDEVKKQIQSQHDKIVIYSKELATKEADYNNLKEKLENQKQEISSIQDKFALEFKNLANEIMEEKSKTFTEQNKVNITQLLKPLGEKITDFEKKVNDVYDKEAQQRFSLKEEVKRLAELNQQISKEATNLTNALKGQSKTQGNWGEIILERILEKSGLQKDREYYTQASFTDEKGKRLQPDIIVKYPGNKNVVIDSKVSVVAYEKYSSASDPAEQDNYLKEHLLSIRKHINDLSSKNYQDIYQINSLDFVMLFMPIEPAYLLAIQSDQDLWSYAYERKILLISPTNLIAALKMIASLWQQEYQNRNALEIARLGGTLYDKMVGFIEDLQDVKQRLEKAQSGLDNSINKLATGKGNILRQTQKIQILGAKTKKNIPQNILDQMDEE